MPAFVVMGGPARRGAGGAADRALEVRLGSRRGLVHHRREVRGKVGVRARVRVRVRVLGQP